MQMCTLSISNVTCHKFLHGAASYMLNEKTVNVRIYNIHLKFVKLSGF